MRTEVKAGIIAGVILLAALIIYVSTRTGSEGDVSFDNPSRTVAGSAEPAGDKRPVTPGGSRARPGGSPSASSQTPPRRATTPRTGTNTATNTDTDADPLRTATGNRATHSTPPRSTTLTGTPHSTTPAGSRSTAARGEPPARSLDDLDRAAGERTASTPDRDPAGDSQAPNGTRASENPYRNFVSLPDRAADARRETNPAPPPTRRTTPGGTTPPTPTPRATGTTYTVEHGDIFIHIVRDHYGDGDYWRAVAAANPTINPDLIRPGQKIILPPKDQVVSRTTTRPTPPTRGESSTTRRAAAGDQAVYVVESGDTLTKIAENILGDGARYNEIFELNRDQLESADEIQAGMKLKMPR